jgi:hypothetical protein
MVNDMAVVIGQKSVDDALSCVVTRPDSFNAWKCVLSELKIRLAGRGMSNVGFFRDTSGFFPLVSTRFYVFSTRFQQWKYSVRTPAEPCQISDALRNSWILPGARSTQIRLVARHMKNVQHYGKL